MQPGWHARCKLGGMMSFFAKVLAAVLACGLSVACAARAQTPSALPQAEPAQDEPTLPPDDQGHKNYVFPVVEIVAMDAALNLAGRLVLDPATFEVSSASIRRNL